ncbi:MAG: hypothetical protein GX785_02300 [Armatimonadetes bacterium]|jgi:putative transposase|nr:hypothetical protein [Armatimonadota bacterium]HPO73536.1 hypothetical protein [Armatimonadota bacterium]
MHADRRWRGKSRGSHRPAWLMRKNGLVVRRRRSYRVTTDTKHKLPVAGNLLDRRFEAGAANRVWVADITYVPRAERGLSLAVVLDLGSRRAVRWSMGVALGRGLAMAALEKAIVNRKPNAGLSTTPTEDAKLQWGLPAGVGIAGDTRVDGPQGSSPIRPR